jgi:hypothetical protein
LENKKKASTGQAYQAFEPHNMLKVQWFWTQAPSALGVYGVPRRKFIDVDEFGIVLERTNLKFAWAVRFFRRKKPGHYTRNTKLTVLLAIEPGNHILPANVTGSVELPRRWIRVIMSQGMTITVFNNFVDNIGCKINTTGLHLHGFDIDNHRILLWDNLISHLAPLITQTIYGRNGPCHFTSVPLLHYQPKYGPIE